MNQTNSSSISKFSGLTWPLYARLVVACCGIVTNAINIWVFLNPKLKDLSYNYMLISSVTNFFYLCISLMTVFFTFCINCQSSTAYLSTIYSIGFTFYFSSSLAFFRITIEVVLSLNTYCTLTNRNWLNKIPYKRIVFVLFAFALLIYGQQRFSYSIVQIKGPTGYAYSTQNSVFGDSDIGKFWAIGQSCVRLILAVFVITTLNVLNAIEFRKSSSQKKVGILVCMVPQSLLGSLYFN